MPPNLNKPYTLRTTLQPNKTYSCFGIKIRVEEEVDTLSNDGNFELRIKNINLKELEFQSKGKIVKDTPIFCYNQESLQTTFAKLANDTVSIKTTISETIINKAKQGLINPYLLNLSFIPFKDNYEANNSPSQKIALIADDINKGSVKVTNKIPNMALGKSNWIQAINQTKSNESSEILSLRFNGKALQILENGKITQEYTFKAQSGDGKDKDSMIDEGIYYIKLNEILESNAINRKITFIDMGNLDDKYIRLYENKEAKESKKDDSFASKIFNVAGIQTTKYTIHGGKSYGDTKGIDVANEDARFLKALENLTNKYKIALAKAGNVVRVEVGYGSIEIARLKAFMYALRYGEGTLYYKGYKTLVGGGTLDDFSKHPNKKIAFKYFDSNKKEYTTIYSTAAGAYQFLSKTWNAIVVKFGKRYGINDFSPKNQDKGCLILIKHYCKVLNQIKNGNIQEAIKKCRNIWASLPNATYGQRTETTKNFMKYFNKHLKEELQGISNLAITNEEVAEF